MVPYKWPFMASKWGVILTTFRNAANHLECIKPIVNNGISTTVPSTGDRRISEPSAVCFLIPTFDWYPLVNQHIPPWEVWKIIDSKVPFQRDMFVSRRVEPENQKKWGESKEKNMQPPVSGFDRGIACLAGSVEHTCRMAAVRKPSVWKVANPKNSVL